MAWNNNYRNGGITASLDYKISRVNILGVINPHYDSFFHYKTCFLVGGKVDVSKQIAITADYNTIPTYRESEQRVRGGIEINVGSLQLKPVVSLPVEGNNKFKSFRVECSFRYTFLK